MKHLNNYIFERLILSKNNKYPLDYESINVERDIDVEFFLGDRESFSDALLAGYILYGDKYEPIGLFVLTDNDSCNICFLHTKVELKLSIPNYTSHSDTHGDIEGKCEVSNKLLEFIRNCCKYAKPLALNIFTDDLELPDFLNAISTSGDDFADADRELIIDEINDMFDTKYTGDDICSDI